MRRWRATAVGAAVLAATTSACSGGGTVEVEDGGTTVSFEVPDDADVWRTGEDHEAVLARLVAADPANEDLWTPQLTGVDRGEQVEAPLAVAVADAPGGGVLALRLWREAEATASDLDALAAEFEEDLSDPVFGLAQAVVEVDADELDGSVTAAAGGVMLFAAELLPTEGTDLVLTWFLVDDAGAVWSFGCAGPDHRDPEDPDEVSALDDPAQVTSELREVCERYLATVAFDTGG